MSPLYEYQCTRREECNHTFQRVRPVADRDKCAPCPECFGNTLRIAVQPVSFVLAGGGWADSGYQKRQK